MDERSRVLMATCLGRCGRGRLGLALHDGKRTPGSRPDRAEARRLHDRGDARARHGREGPERGQRRVAVAERHGRRQHAGPLVGIGRPNGGSPHHEHCCSSSWPSVSVLEALLLIGIGIGGFIVYRRVMQLVTDLEARQIAPLREKVDAILGGRQDRDGARQPADRARRPRHLAARWTGSMKPPSMRQGLGDGQGESCGRASCAASARRSPRCSADRAQAEAARYGRGTAVEAGRPTTETNNRRLHGIRIRSLRA